MKRIEQCFELEEYEDFVTVTFEGFREANARYLELEPYDAEDFHAYRAERALQLARAEWHKAILKKYAPDMCYKETA